MTDVLAPVARQLFLNPSTGAPYAGAKIFTYAAGTTTKLATYTDSTGGTPNTNPIILDALGECDIWIPDSTAYKFVFSPPTDTDPPTNAIWTRDQISFPSTTAVPTLSVAGQVLSGQVLGVNGQSLFHGTVTNDLGGFSTTAAQGYLTQFATASTIYNSAGIFGGGASPVSIQVVSKTGGVILNEGATAWAAISERAKKKNIEPIIGALDIVCQLEAATGHYITEDDSAKRHPFLFYEDFEALWPYPLQYRPATVVLQDEKTGEDIIAPEFKGLSKEEVVPLLVAAIQELRAEVARLRAEIPGLA